MGLLPSDATLYGVPLASPAPAESPMAGLVRRRRPKPRPEDAQEE